MIDTILFSIGFVGFVALILLVLSSATKNGLRKHKALIPFVTTSPIYKPRWKKLKYWEPTKKNPKRR